MNWNEEQQLIQETAERVRKSDLHEWLKHEVAKREVDPVLINDIPFPLGIRSDSLRQLASEIALPSGWS